MVAKTWTGSVSSDWANANNWSPPGVPGASDVITIPAGMANSPTIAANTAYGGGLTLTSGADLKIASGDKLTLSGTTSLSGDVTGLGTLALTRGATTLDAGVSLTMGAFTVTGTTALTVAASVSVGKKIDFSKTASIAIDSDDTLTLTGAATLNSAISGAGTLALTGSGVKTSVSTAETVSSAFTTAAGTKVSIGSGDSLTLEGENTLGGGIGGLGGLVLAGATTINAGAAVSTSTVEISGMTTVDEKLTYGQTLTEDADATVSVANDDALILMKAATFDGSVTGGGALTISGGTTTFASGSTLSTANLTVESTGAALNVQDDLTYAGALTDGAGGTIDVATDDTLTLTGTAVLSGAIAGAGTLDVAGATTTTMSGASLKIADLMTSGSGKLMVNASLSYDDELTVEIGSGINVASDDMLTLSGVALFDGAVSGLGGLTIADGGSATFDSGAKLSVSSWTLTGNGTLATIDEALTFLGSFTQEAGATLTLSAAKTSPLILKGSSDFANAMVNGAGKILVEGATDVAGLTIGGTACWELTSTATELSGGLTLGAPNGGPSELIIGTSGTYDLEDSNGINWGNGQAAITNQGLLEKTVGTGESTVGTGAIDPDLTNAGEILVTSGTLNFTSEIGGTGTEVVNAGAILELSEEVLSAQTLSFSGAGGEISLQDMGVNGVSVFKGQISGYASGDMIDIGAPYVDNDSLSYFFTENSQNTGGTLKLTHEGSSASINFLGANINTGDFTPQTDGNGGTLFKF